MLKKRIMITTALAMILLTSYIVVANNLYGTTTKLKDVTELSNKLVCSKVSDKIKNEWCKKEKIDLTQTELKIEEMKLDSENNFFLITNDKIKK